MNKNMVDEKIRRNGVNRGRRDCATFELLNVKNQILNSK